MLVDSPMNETFMTFSEESNALDYFERAAHFIQETSTDSHAWKWVILSLHGALYGFAICACKGSDGETVTRKTKQGPRLISFSEALSACQDPNRMQMTVLSKPLILNNDQRASINHLQRFLRNPFEHYIPMSWHIEINGMPTIAIHCIEVIRFLALNTGNYIMLAKDENDRIDLLTDETIEFLRAMTNKYNLHE